MRAIIIDDEQHAVNVLEKIIKKHCPDIQIVAIAKNGIEGKQMILDYRPDLIFLDIEMPQLNAFQMLESLNTEDLTFTIIFTTAHNQYAIRAFKYAAFDYLLKPIDEEELIKSIDSIVKKNTSIHQIQQLKSNFEQKENFNILTIAHTRGLTFIQVSEIIMLEADGNYTKIFTVSSGTVVASKTLGYFEDLLSNNSLFFRSHKQFIININFIKEYLSGDYNEIILKNGLPIKLARTRRDAFLKMFRNH